MKKRTQIIRARKLKYKIKISKNIKSKRSPDYLVNIVDYILRPHNFKLQNKVRNIYFKVGNKYIYGM